MKKLLKAEGKKALVATGQATGQVTPTSPDELMVLFSQGEPCDTRSNYRR